MEVKKSKIVLYISIGLAIFTILPVLAPIFAKLGIEPLADAIYWMYQWFCHQRPWRSYHLFDYQLAIDARMILMFASMSIGGFMVYIKRITLKNFTHGLIIAAIFSLPLAIDGFVQLIAEINTPSDTLLPFYESTNFVRSSVGALLGTGISFGFFPFLQTFDKNTMSKKSFIKYLSVALGLSLLIIPIITLSWYLTSQKYMPGNPFFDNVQRFPGYNYEITTEAGHSTIKKFIEFPSDKYIKRAEIHGRQDLIDQYNQNK